MSLRSRLSSVWRNLVQRDRTERDLDDEVRAAVELLVDEKLRAGMRPEDARRAATLELGYVESIKEQVRDVRAGALVETFLYDVRYGVRLLFRSPVFSVFAVASLREALAPPPRYSRCLIASSFASCRYPSRIAW